MHPILLHSDLFIIHTLWVFFFAAVIIGTYTLIKLTIFNRLKIQFISDNSWKILLLALIGARIVAVINNFNIYFYELSLDSFLGLFAFWDRGLSIWGAFAAILIYFYYKTKKEEQEFKKWLDVLIPSFIIGLAISHLGAFFDGINYGNETSLPWGVNFENPSIKYAVPIHPTQIYAFLYASAISIKLIILNHQQKYEAGLIGIMGITSYSACKFLEEFVRGDDVWLIFGIRYTHIITTIVLIISATLLYKKLKK